MVLRMIGIASRRDPSTFIGAFAVWAACCGVSLIMPGNVFGHVQTYNLMEYVYPNELRWGALMLFDAALLVSSLYVNSVAYRCAVAGASAVLWTFCGVLMVSATWQDGWFSIVGSYSLWGAFSCLIAIEQWIHHGAAGVGD